MQSKEKAARFCVIVSEKVACHKLYEAKWDFPQQSLVKHCEAPKAFLVPVAKAVLAQPMAGMHYLVVCPKFPCIPFSVRPICNRGLYRVLCSHRNKSVSEHKASLQGAYSIELLSARDDSDRALVDKSNEKA